MEVSDYKNITESIKSAVTYPRLNRTQKTRCIKITFARGREKSQQAGVNCGWLGREKCKSVEKYTQSFILF